MIPIGHDRQVTRRLPIATISLIALNCIVFIVQAIVSPQQERALDLSLEKVIDYSLSHPGVKLPVTAAERLARVPDFYLRELKGRLVAESLPGRPRGDDVVRVENILHDDADIVASEMKRRCDVFVQNYDANFNLKFGFIPRSHHSSWSNYLTNLFMHSGWEHLAGNMLCLFVVGIALEDTWGALIYIIFYLAGGVAATLTHAYSAPDSKVVCMGASGAIASLMGAFLVRHFRARIKLFIFVAVIRVPAYFYFPLIVALDVRNSFIRSPDDIGGVAFWAHIGGFMFGAVASAFLYHSGVERLLAPTGTRVGSSFGTGNAISEARRHIENCEFGEAARKLIQRTGAVPDDLEALDLLAMVYSETDEHILERTTRLSQIRAALQISQREAALRAYSDFLDSFEEDESAGKLPLSDWLAICRYLTEKQMFGEAAGEYEKLVRAYPDEPRAAEFLARAAACRERLADFEYARRLYLQAQNQEHLTPALLIRISQGLTQTEGPARSAE